MKKFKFYYFTIAVAITVLILWIFGITGEGGIVAFYLTMALTFPIGMLVSYIFDLLSQAFNPYYVEIFFIPSAAIASYFQWKFLISLYRKWKPNSKTNQ